MIVGHGNALGIECIRLNDISPCIQVLPMNVLNDMRSGQTQQIIVALHLPRLANKSCTPEILFRKIVFLNHSSESAIQNQDALTDQFLNSHTKRINA